MTIDLLIFVIYATSSFILLIACCISQRGWKRANRGWEHANLGWRQANDYSAKVNIRIEELLIENTILKGYADIDAIHVVRDVNGKVLAIHVTKYGRSKEVYKL